MKKIISFIILIVCIMGCLSCGKDPTISFKHESISINMDETFEVLETDITIKNSKDDYVLKIVDSIDLDATTRETTRLRLFQFSLRDQASNWLERLPAGSISSWDDLTSRFLAKFFPPGRTSKLRNDILIFRQYQGETEIEQIR